MDRGNEHVLWYEEKNHLLCTLKRYYSDTMHYNYRHITIMHINYRTGLASDTVPPHLRPSNRRARQVGRL